MLRYSDRNSRDDEPRFPIVGRFLLMAAGILISACFLVTVSYLAPVGKPYRAHMLTLGCLLILNAGFWLGRGMPGKRK